MSSINSVQMTYIEIRKQSERIDQTQNNVRNFHLSLNMCTIINRWMFKSLTCKRALFDLHYLLLRCIRCFPDGVFPRCWQTKKWPVSQYWNAVINTKILAACQLFKKPKWRHYRVACSRTRRTGSTSHFLRFLFKKFHLRQIARIVTQNRGNFPFSFIAKDVILFGKAKMVYDQINCVLWLR